MAVPSGDGSLSRAVVPVTGFPPGRVLQHVTTTVLRHYAGAAEGTLPPHEVAEVRLHDALANAWATVRATERQAFRDYHGATVATASVLVAAAFSRFTLDLDAAVLRLGPDGVAEAWLVGPRFAARARHAGNVWRPGLRDGYRLGERDRLLHTGHVVRCGSDPAGAVGVRFSEHGLEIAFRLPGVLVRTLGEVATLIVDHPVPEVLKASLAGRGLAEVVDHPLLRDPRLVIEEVGGLDGDRTRSPGAWRMTVSVPRVAWSAPWARDPG